MTKADSYNFIDGTARPAARDPAQEPPSAQLSSLLQQLESLDAGVGGTGSAEAHYENRLVEARLGVANSLFAALRSRHAETASHSLRVALSCSAWALAMQQDEAFLNDIEIAALLHDLGKIGVPDNILLKPGKLNESEIFLLRKYHGHGVEILASCCNSPTILDIVRFVHVHYNGTNSTSSFRGSMIPLGARMLAIADAFDSMTTDHVYRPAMSRERALAELATYGGSQFDPDLVRKFSELHQSDELQLHNRVVRRWLNDVDESFANRQWEMGNTIDAAGPANDDEMFQNKLLESMRDAVIFVDSNCQIRLWNHGAERLSGIAASSVHQRKFSPTLLNLRDEQGNELLDDACPVQFVVSSGVQSIRRLSMKNKKGNVAFVDIQVVPVIAEDGTTHGASLIMHDSSDEASLEERCQSLYEKAIRDPMTQVLNRAEFDRLHEVFVRTHIEQNTSCSLIIADIDNFKRVNDDFGHQAGDEAIRTFAQLMKRLCRPGDLVARYGGEEFCMLCADCNNATATARAEKIRRALADLPLDMLGGKAITASFGVTEVQPGDTPETMLRRADRGLLSAKDNGRNRVVQLGGGKEDEEQPKKGWFWWRSQKKLEMLVETDLVTPVPIKVAVEKLRGFIADHGARVDGTEDGKVILSLDGSGGSLFRRSEDRRVGYVMELTFSREQVADIRQAQEEKSGQAANLKTHERTRMNVVIRPQRNRDRRQQDATIQARQVFSSLRSYLMATEVAPLADESALKRTTSNIAAWLAR